MPTRSSYVVTFYSYKGGVGRTTLLVNTAFERASRGHRVVIWDLDLEAPGLHEFTLLQPPEAIWHSGFLEWMRDQTSALAGNLTPQALDHLVACSYELRPEVRSPGDG